MAQQTQQQLRFVRNKYSIPRYPMGGAVDAVQFKEAASQSWLAGDLLQYTAGTVVILPTGTFNSITGIPTSSTPNTGVGAQVLGQAEKDASGITGTAVEFLPIREGDRFEMNVYHGTIGSAVTANTMIGKRFPVRKISGL